MRVPSQLCNGPWDPFRSFDLQGSFYRGAQYVVVQQAVGGAASFWAYEKARQYLKVETPKDLNAACTPQSSSRTPTQPPP